MDLPDLQADDVVSLVKRVYGFDVTDQSKLNSTDDINIHVTVTVSSDNPSELTPATDGYVLKILNSVDSTKVEFIGKWVVSARLFQKLEKGYNILAVDSQNKLPLI